MNAYDIATTNIPSMEPWTSMNLDAIKNFILFVKETNDPDVKGLVSMMAKEIQHHRLDGREYMGGASKDMSKCVADSEVLLARVLLRKSSSGSPSGYVVRQLQKIAWYISTEEQGNDSFHNWIMAQRRYVRAGLKYLEEIQSPKPSRSEFGGHMAGDSPRS